jgi:hypothetical protein
MRDTESQHRRLRWADVYSLQEPGIWVNYARLSESRELTDAPISAGPAQQLSHPAVHTYLKLCY